MRTPAPPPARPATDHVNRHAVRISSGYATRYARLPTGERLAYWRAGHGRPVLLVHGYPETRRIWARNIGELAAAGFDVIAPDLPGYGDSDPPAGGVADIPTYSAAMSALVRDVLGLPACAAIAGDVGAQVVLDAGVRYPGLVHRQIIFNTTAPQLRDAYRAAGIPPDLPRRQRPQSAYFLRQGTAADELAAELRDDDQRRDYVRDFYLGRGWAMPGAFSEDEASWHAEPFGDRARLRLAWHVYEVACGTRPPAAMPRLFEPVTVPSAVLYGAADPVVPSSFPRKCRVAFLDCLGPLAVPDCGHFVQWERADVVNRLARHFFS
jgi:pimeloyl-ACP methyl ester carboxylesterase